ncbi:hypothetical protein FACS189425_07720 [Clostridia bacterium]|nr:hypothetical protein FACS189425_07720 [Clostridia bacterium]
MKKLAVCFLFIMALSISSISAVYAQSREEFAGNLVDIFELRADYKGLYNYSDWLRINVDLRKKVSAAAQTGVYKPASGQYRPAQDVQVADKEKAIYGVDRYVLQSPSYIKILGVVTELNNASVTIKTDSGIWLDCPFETPFLGDSGILTCRQLQVGDLVSFVQNKDEKIVLVWHQKNIYDNSKLENYELVAIRHGSLYLYDDPRFMFILTNPEEFKFGDWLPLGSKYDDLLVHDAAKVILNGMAMDRAVINSEWLDRQINYVVGQNPMDDGKFKILHIEYE